MKRKPLKQDYLYWVFVSSFRFSFKCFWTISCEMRCLNLNLKTRQYIHAFRLVEKKLHLYLICVSQCVVQGHFVLCNLIFFWTSVDRSIFRLSIFRFSLETIRHLFQLLLPFHKRHKHITRKENLATTVLYTN